MSSPLFFTWEILPLQPGYQTVLKEQKKKKKKKMKTITVSVLFILYNAISVTRC